MITLVRDTLVAAKLITPEEARELSFLKYSTPSSGKNMDDKVLFFVFKAHSAEPIFCVKTIRNSESRESIIGSFENLKKIHTLVAGSRYEHLFARPVHVYDDGEHIFSIETVCPGQRLTFGVSQLEFVIKTYTEFQEYLAKKEGIEARDEGQIMEEMIARANLGADDVRKVKDYIFSLGFSGSLPSVLQHGDMTPDNLLISGDRLHIVDCDYVGLIDIPGFDLFGLFFRLNPDEAKILCRKYLPGYFQKIGAKVGDRHDGLLFLYYFTERVIRKPKGLSVDEMFSEFEKYFL